MAQLLDLCAELRGKLDDIERINDTLGKHDTDSAMEHLTAAAACLDNVLQDQKDRPEVAGDTATLAYNPPTLQESPPIDGQSLENAKHQTRASKKVPDEAEVRTLVYNPETAQNQTRKNEKDTDEAEGTTLEYNPETTRIQTRADQNDLDEAQDATLGYNEENTREHKKSGRQEDGDATSGEGEPGSDGEDSPAQEASLDALALRTGADCGTIRGDESERVPTSEERPPSPVLGRTKLDGVKRVLEHDGPSSNPQNAATKEQGSHQMVSQGSSEMMRAQKGQTRRPFLKSPTSHTQPSDLNQQFVQTLPLEEATLDTSPVSERVPQPTLPVDEDGSLSHGESPNPAKGHGKNRDQSNAPQRDAKRRRENGDVYVESVPPASRRRGRIEETSKTEDLSHGRAARGRQEGVRALFSGYVPEKQDMKRFQALGVEEVEDPRRCTHLILDPEKLKTTAKMYAVLALGGRPIVIKSWLERSHEAKHILSVDKFLVDSPDLKHGNSTAMQRTLPLWKGLSFLYQQPFKMPKEDCKMVIECGGGRFFQEKRNAPTGAIILCDNKSKGSGRARGGSTVEYQSFEFLKRACLDQTVDREKHRLL